MSNMTDWHIEEAMIRYGGGFVTALGTAMRRADKGNKARLVAAFPEYMEQYRELAALKAQATASKVTSPPVAFATIAPISVDVQVAPIASQAEVSAWLRVVDAEVAEERTGELAADLPKGAQE